MATAFQRARKPIEKEDRRSHLLSTARAILLKNPDLSALSLNELARSAKMAKSNVYRYFETREAVLLSLLWSEWSAWQQEFLEGLKKSPRPTRKLNALVTQISKSLTERRLLCALTAALPTVVEHNLSDSTIHDFKRGTLQFLFQTGASLESYCPELTSDEYSQLLYDAACLLAGLYPHAYPSNPVTRVLKDPELHFFKRDLSQDLERFLILLATSSSQGKKAKSKAFQP